MTKKEKQKIQERKEFLKQVRMIFEPRYNEKLSDERVEIMAKNITNFAKVCQNAYAKRQGLKPMYQI